MPEPDHIVKRNDKGVTISAVLTDENDAPVNLSGASGMFRMAPISGGSLVVNATATIAVGTVGEISYEWQDVDTDTAGWYVAEWQITYGGGDIQTFPNGGYTVIQIPPDLPVP